MTTKYPRMFGILAAVMLVASFVVPSSFVGKVEADPGICKWDNLSEPGAAYGLFSIYANEIQDWAIASDGTNLAAIVKIQYPALAAYGGVTYLLQSPAYTGLYWSSGKNTALTSTTGFNINIGGGVFVPRRMYQVVYSPDNPNFWAVTSAGAASPFSGPRELWVTQNGGANWQITNLELKLNGAAAGGDETIRCIDISVDYGGRRDIIVGTTRAAGQGQILVCQSTGFTGWVAQSIAAITGAGATVGNVSFFAVKASPSYSSDAAVAVVFADDSNTYYNVALRDLDLNAINQWAFTMPGVEVTDPTKANTSPARQVLNKVDLELPSDFSGQAASLRRAYISTDVYDCGAAKSAWDGIVRMDNNTVYVLMDTSNKPQTSIYSIAYFGTYASGKLLAGDRIGYPCEATVPTYFTDSPTTCPIPCWYDCLKCPTGAACGAGACNCPTFTPSDTCAPGNKNGVGAAIVFWRPNGQLAFASTGSIAADNGTATSGTGAWWYCLAFGPTTPCDESAFSISRNNGETWNQFSLIDTEVTQFTDIAPSADCKTIYLASVNDGCGANACTQGITFTCDNSTSPPTFQYLLKGSPSCASCNNTAGTSFNLLVTSSYDAVACGCRYTISGNWTYLANCAGACYQINYLTPMTGLQLCGSANTTLTLTAACNTSACCGTALEECCGFDSVWRTSSNADVVSPIANLPVGTHWERVFTHTTSANCDASQSNWALLRLVGWCADPTGEVVGWAAMGRTTAFWSPDYGDYWAPITVRNTIQDFTFESRTMLYFLGTTGLVQKMPFTGTSWSTSLPNYDSTISPAHTIASMPEGKVLVGKAAGAPYAVAWSLNMDGDNPTFGTATTAGPLMGGNVHVAFDPNFDDNSIIYIADDAGSVYRNSPTAQLRWPDTDMLAASNGAVGCFPFSRQNGYTGLLLGYTGGALYASSALANAGVVRTIDDGTGKYGALSSMPKPGIAWDQLNVGLTSAVVSGVLFTAQPSALKACGCCTLETDTTLYALDNRPYVAATATAPLTTVGKIWGFTDCLAKRGPSLITEDKTLIGCDPVTGRAQEVNLCWEQLCVADAYDIEIAKVADFSIRVIDWFGENGCYGHSPADVTIPCMYIPSGGTFTYTESSLADAIFGVMECGHTYWWRVKVRECATGQAIRSPWSEVRTFSVKAGLPVVASYSGLQLLAPANGMIGLPVKSASFSWAPLGENTKYKFTLAKDGNMTQIVKEAEVANTAYAYDGTLDYSTPYFWKVQCVEPACDSSPTFSFMTESAPPAAEEATKAPPTPFWVWVVIAIGAILVIVTLVLIFKTRRV